MNKGQLFVSVIIPVYNGGKYLAEAIQTVRNQHYQSLEIIVVDDGSTDNTPTVATQFQDSIRYVYQENSGPAAARNRGISMAKGDIIAFLDVDDLWPKDKLKLQVSYLAAHPSVDIIQGSIQQIHLSASASNQVLDLTRRDSSKSYKDVNLGSALYRKYVFEKVGLFDETLSFAEDVDWFIRAWEHGISKVILEDVTLFYRKHDTNMTIGKSLVELGFVKVFKRHLDRGRQRDSFTYIPKQGMPSIAQYLGLKNG